MAGRAAAPLRRRAPARSGARSGSAPGAEPARAPLLVFLDIDGVLLPFGDPPADGEGRDAGNMRFPERCIASLQRILRETGARLVLSSTWRCAGGADAILDEFRNFSAAQHKRAGQRLLSCPLDALAQKGKFEFETDPSYHSHRQWEIAAWLESARSEGLKFESWCALDDEELVSSSPVDGGGDFNKRWQSLFKDRHIKTLSNVGLTDDDASAAIMALQRPFSWDDHTDAMPQQQESLKAKAMGSTDEWKGSKIGQSGNKSRKRTSQIKA